MSEKIIKVLDTAVEKINFYWEEWPHILKQYLSSSKLDVSYIDRLSRSKSKLSRTRTVIHKLKGVSWEHHRHATIQCTFGKKEYVFNHSDTYIYIDERSPDKIERAMDNSRVLCDIQYGPDNTMYLGDLIKFSIIHWYIVNVLPTVQQTSWPASCTGFTDIILYFIYGRDILNKCPLTLQIKEGDTVKHYLFTKKPPTNISIENSFCI